MQLLEKVLQALTTVAIVSVFVSGFRACGHRASSFSFGHPQACYEANQGMRFLLVLPPRNLDLYTIDPVGVIDIDYRNRLALQSCLKPALSKAKPDICVHQLTACLATLTCPECWDSSRMFVYRLSTVGLRQERCPPIGKAVKRAQTHLWFQSLSSLLQQASLARNLLQQASYTAARSPAPLARNLNPKRSPSPGAFQWTLPDDP